MDLLATMALDRDAINTVTLRLLPPSASTPSPSPSSPGSGGAAATASSGAPETASPWLLIHTIPITASLSRTLSRLVSIEDAAMAQAAAAAGAGAGAGGVGVSAGRPSSGARVSCSSTPQSPAPSSSGRPMLLRSVASAAAPSAATLAEAAAPHTSLNSPCGTPAATMAPAPGAVSSTKSASASAGHTELLTTPPPTRLRGGLTSGTQLDHPDAASATTATNSSVPATPIHSTAAAKPAATSSHTRRLRSLSSTSSSSAASFSSSSSSSAASPSSSTSSCAPKRVSLLSPASEAVHRSCSTPETDRAGWVELVRVGYIVSEIHAYCILVKCQRAAQAAVMKAALEEGAALGLTAPVEFVSDARPVVVTHRTFAESRARAVEPDGAVAAADAARGKERSAGAERWRADVHTTTLLEAITTVYPVRGGGEPGDGDYDDDGAQRAVAGAAAGVADGGAGDDAERNGYASDEDGGTTRAGHHDPHRHHHHHQHDRREAHHALRLPPAATQSSASATPPPLSQPRARGATTADGVRKGAAPPPSRHASAAAAAAQHGNNSSSSPACTSPSHALTPSLRGSPGRHAHTRLHLPLSAGGGGGGATLSVMGRWGGRGSASAMAAAATTATMRGAVPLRGGEFCAICLDPLLPRACVTTLCQHAFHLRCYAQLPSGSAECPLCRFTVYDLLNDARCKVCGTYEDLWVCLLCGHVACGRARRDHQQDHFQASGHSCAWQSSTNRIRNLSSRMFLHQEVALLLGDDDSAAGEEEAESLASRRTSGAAAPTTASEDATASASGVSAHPTTASAAAAAARDAASSTGVQRARYMSWLDSPEDSELQALLSESKEEAVAQYYTQFLRQLAEEQQRFYEARLAERRRRRERRHGAASNAENAATPTATPPDACGTAASASTPTMSFTSVVRDERRQRRHVLADYVQGSISLSQEAQRAYASMAQGLRATRDAAQQQVLLQSHLNAGMLAEAEQVVQRTQEAQRKGEKASQAKAAEEARLQARVAEALASL